MVADGAHERGEFGRAEESRNGVWQVAVGGRIARNKPANSRQDFAKIPAIEITRQTVGRLGEFQDGDGAARFEHALNLAQSGFVVGDRKSTRLNSSHSQISYAVFCLKKKKKQKRK